MKTFKGNVEYLKPNQIFVFGANFDGIHGAGAALWALENAGAIWGQSKGLQGQSYGIITKNLRKKRHPSVSIAYILHQLEELKDIALKSPDKEFLIAYTAHGANLNGYTPQQMINMFATVNWPENVIFEEEFYSLMLKRKQQLISIYQPILS